MTVDAIANGVPNACSRTGRCLIMDFKFCVVSLLLFLPTDSFSDTALQKRLDPLMPSSDIRALALEPELPGGEGNEFYRAIARLHGSLTCTASFIHTSDKADAPAYLLTNGHCAFDPLEPDSGNRIVLNADVPDTPYTAEFNYFHDTLDQTIQVRIVRITYATMKGQDIAILQTDQTVSELESRHLTPLRISPVAPEKDQAVTVAGIPINRGALILSRCSTGSTTDVIENYWHWSGLTSNNCTGISSGSSGGPVFDLQQPAHIVGITNTSNIGAVGDTCYAGNPCKIDESGVGIDRNTNYQVPTTYLSACFDPSGTFNLYATGCQLPKPSTLTISEYPFVYSGENAQYGNTWKFKLRGSGDFVKFKTVDLNRQRDSCHIITGYSQPIKLSDFDVSDAPMPIYSEGPHQYCIIRADNLDATDPEVVQVLIDNTAPDVSPPVQFTPSDDLLITPVFLPPEYVDYSVAVGELGHIDCETATYTPYRRIPIHTALVPTTLCINGADFSENRSKNFVLQYVPQ